VTVIAAAAEPSIDVGALWHKLRLPVAIGLVGLALVAGLAAIGTSPNSDRLDPRNPTPDGARALSVLLAERGVAVHIASTLSQAKPGQRTTVLLSRPGAVSRRALHDVLATSATVVLIDPPPAALAASGVPAIADQAAAGETVDPQCGLPVATVAGSVRLTGTLYAVTGAATRCYAEGGDASLVVASRANGARTVIFGSGSTLSNADLDKQGDAALAIGLLDAPVLQWVPAGLGLGKPPPSHQGLLNLLPNRLVAALVQLAIALIVLALWRARRLGKPVAEPLPVIVRAAETVEGRARLLQAARSRGTAAAALRAASTRRLAQTLRLGADEAPATVVAVVAEAAHTPATTVNAVLYGGEPTDDRALVALAQQLPDLEAAVRSDAQPSGGSS
jgi:hypothetical protein